MKNLFLVGIVVLAVGLAGCVGQDIVPVDITTTTIHDDGDDHDHDEVTTTTLGDMEDGVKEFTIDITHASGYSQTELTVNKGDTVRLFLTSSPVDHEHGVEIDIFDIHEVVTVGSSGEPQVIEFVASEVGEHKIFCGEQTCMTSTGWGDHFWWLEAKLVVVE